MVDYKKYVLQNGLTLMVQRDRSTPIAALNIIYKVGSRNENPELTGFAHLFEHLMFSGSKNIESFDRELQLAGGENNAFTCADYTSYYTSLPKNNLEIALWLEADRMLYPNITQENLDLQRSVVIEEFNQRYLNQPYGDCWLILRPLAYKVHPYRWPTIGKTIDHIKNASLDDVKNFFDDHYAPNNAILSIVADIDPDEVYALVEKWFGSIPSRLIKTNNIPIEPEQKELRTLSVERNVPASCFFKAYKMCDRQSRDYYVCDLLTDILSSGNSSRMYQRLLKDINMFSSVNAFISGERDPGLLVVSGRLLDNVDMKTAESVVDAEIQKICTEKVSEYELNKVNNKVESAQIFSETSIQNKAMFMSYYENLNRLDLLEDEIGIYKSITADDILRVAKEIFVPEKCSTLYYYGKTEDN